MLVKFDSNSRPNYRISQNNVVLKESAAQPIDLTRIILRLLYLFRNDCELPDTIAWGNREFLGWPSILFKNLHKFLNGMITTNRVTWNRNRSRMTTVYLGL